MIIYVFCNLKGGVGKSTSAEALGAWLCKKGKKVLYTDLDPQGNLSYTLMKEEPDVTVFDILTKEENITVCPTDQGDIIPADSSLSRADIAITETGKEYRLREALESVRKKYDYCLIDCPPSVGILTVNALTAADHVIIPVQADLYSLQGLGQMYGTISTVKKYCNKKLDISGLLITRYNGRSVLTKNMTDLLEETAQKLGTKVYNTRIRECIAVKEAQAKRTDIFSYRKSNASVDYDSLAKEIFGEV